MILDTNYKFTKPYQIEIKLMIKSNKTKGRKFSRFRKTKQSNKTLNKLRERGNFKVIARV